VVNRAYYVLWGVALIFLSTEASVFEKHPVSRPCAHNLSRTTPLYH
jgi:hypothetical protein